MDKFFKKEKNALCRVNKPQIKTISSHPKTYTKKARAILCCYLSYKDILAHSISKVLRKDRQTHAERGATSHSLTQLYSFHSTTPCNNAGQ